jgi:hypothetical protein
MTQEDGHGTQQEGEHGTQQEEHGTQQQDGHGTQQEEHDILWFDEPPVVSPTPVNIPSGIVYFLFVSYTMLILYNHGQ